MECRNCGKATKEARPFCGVECMIEWRHANRTKPGNWRPSVSASDGLPPQEAALRRELLKHAREGQPEAQAALKYRYGVTALWDGQRLINL